MDGNKLTRGHYIAATISLLFGVGSVAVEWGNNGLQRPFMWLPLVGLLVALGYLVALNAVAKRLKSYLKEWIERGFLVLEVVLLLGFLYALVYPYEWAGLGPQLIIPFVEPAKALWDWLQLIIVPLILAIGGVFINSTIQRSERQRTEDQLQDQRLQNYLDHMSELLIEKGLGREEALGSVKTVARARTLTTLRGLDGERKGLLLKFLHESDLITRELVSVELSSADLQGANLVEANLVEANLAGAHLEGAYLVGAYLVEAYLVGAYLMEAYLEAAYLVGAHLEGAYLMGANLEGANLEGANLEGANLEGANLARANLARANLEGAYLEGASLEGASLERANLEGAYLMGAIVSTKQLAMTKTNKTTVMPDGFHYQHSAPTVNSVTDSEATQDQPKKGQ